MTYSLSELESIKLSKVAQAGTAIYTIEDFSAWVHGPVKALFPHEMMVCALVKICGEEVRIKPLLSVDYPPECLAQLSKTEKLTECWMIRRWLTEYRAQIFDYSSVAASVVTRGQNCSCHCMAKTAAFGCIDKDGQGGTYFSFSKIPGDVTHRHAFLLELLVPYLHQTLTRIIHKNRNQFIEVKSVSRQLTKREQQILSLIATGMSNRAIAENLSRSELTVQNHVQAILKKMGAPNRATAVALIGNVI